jgi:hypothetical protein
MEILTELDLLRDRLDKDYLFHWGKTLGFLPLVEESVAGKFKPKST